jgi:hypothetical protein
MDRHLSDEQLAAFQDQDLPAGDAVHLESCLHCAGRLREMTGALTAYSEYRDSACAPLLPPPQSWTSLDTLIARNANGSRPKVHRWWPRIALAAAACAVIAAVFLNQRAQRQSVRANDLLARSATMTVREGPRLISLRSGGRTLIRPAVLSTDITPEIDPQAERLRSLFFAARYSWRDPLSARSFREWRSGLPDKRDSVSVIRRQGRDDSYRVQTDSPAGVLRSVSLTLRAADLRPTDETFAFAGEGPLDIAEAPAPTPQAPQARPPAVRELPTETLAGPEDTLQVLAALDAIGADVGDPIDVSEDPAHRQIVVRGSGLTPERRKLVAEALKPLPRVVLEFDSGASSTGAAQPPPPAERFSSDIPADFRRQLEDRFGGVVALQQATDRVLETSASLLARAVALQTLALKFPPGIADSMTDRDRALLKKLQQHHVSELRRLLVRMETDLQPLLPASTNGAQIPGADWQSGVPALVASARDTDNLLNHLLAGSYNQASGQDMLQRVASDIERLDAALGAQEQEGR